MTHDLTAARDLAEGIRRVDVWLGLAWLDLKLRYRRTLLGPLWLPLTSVVTIAIMGFVYSKLMHVTLTDYFPYLACGLSLWSLIASFANDAPAVFISAAPIARQTPLPFSLYVLRCVANAVIQFLHTSVSFWAVAICFRIPLGLETLMVIPGLLMLCVFGFWMTLALATVCLRYRDLAQVITMVTQLMFLVTPVFWRIEQLGGQRWLASCNPICHLLEICRAPLLGQPIPYLSWGAVLLFNAVGCLVAYAVFARCRNRLVYWM